MQSSSLGAHCAELWINGRVGGEKGPVRELGVKRGLGSGKKRYWPTSNKIHQNNPRQILGM